MRKAALHNLGCKVNAYETEAMQQLLEEAGYEIVPFKPGADVYVINTCSVTNMADHKSRQILHRAKKMNPDAVVVAVGCYAQAAKADLEKDDAVDLIIGNNKKKDLTDILSRYFEDKEKIEEVIDISASHEYEELHIKKIADHTRAFIKVQDGCNQFCSYCIIPYTRGRVRSRGIDDIINEVEELLKNGYKEIVLTGIHLSSYGVDFPEHEKKTLLDLVIRLDQMEGMERIRLGSLEPRIVTEEFATALASLKTICPHFHLSLQSGCDETLKRMNRHYTAEEYLKRCQILRNHFVNPAITTDVIVGFPGETEDEFAMTKEFLEKVHFYEMHIFKYSKREGTKAATMAGQISEQTKGIRSDILFKMEAELSLNYRKMFLGKTTDVLLEEPIEIDGKSYMTGHTREYIKVAVPFREGLRNSTLRGNLTKMISNEMLYLEEETE